jgi:hypothetical protein
MMESVTATGVAIHGLFQNTTPLKAKWHRIIAPPLPRSSHSLSIINGRAYLFGGEVSPREPVDNDMHIIILPSGTVKEADYLSKPASPTQKDGPVPEKRVGHTASVIGERIFVFGGRGGKEMKPLEENGRVWVYNTRTDKWTALDPVPDTPFPAARSYHASVGLEHPAPRKLPEADLIVNPGTEEPKPGTTAAIATDEEEEGYGTLFIHAGCPSTGRTNDLWGFDVRNRTWREYPSAPGKPRGGTSLAISKSRIYRFGGFNGEGEEGGQVDYIELGVDTFADFSGEGQGEVMISAKRGWDSLVFEGGADTNLAAQGKVGGNRAVPGNRSVAGFQAVTTGMGREYLVLFLGERDPSSEGHDGAGKFYSDVWAFQAPPKVSEIL